MAQAAEQASPGPVDRRVAAMRRLRDDAGQRLARADTGLLALAADESLPVFIADQVVAAVKGQVGFRQPS
jgi:hypothetical protein